MGQVASEPSQEMSVDRLCFPMPVGEKCVGEGLLLHRVAVPTIQRTQNQTVSFEGWGFRSPTINLARILSKCLTGSCPTIR